MTTPGTIYTLVELGERSLRPARVGASILAAEIASGRLSSLDAYDWREILLDGGRRSIKPREYHDDMRVAAEALATWATLHPAAAAGLFSPDQLQAVAGATTDKETQ